MTKNKEELFIKISELDYLPPSGGWECLANIDFMISYFLKKYPNTNFELNRTEFLGLMSVFANEILVSIMLDDKFRKGTGLNKIFKEGFDFRGIRIRVL